MKAVTAFILSLAITVTAFAQQSAPPANQTASPAQEQKTADSSSAAGAKATLYVYWVRSGIGGNNPRLHRRK